MTERRSGSSYTRPLGLFGNPVEHSFSPLFMNRALGLLGLNYRYLAFSIEEADLETALRSLRVLGFRGINVTIPYKRAVFGYLDRIDEMAERIGAVNCITHERGALTGYNTDHAGFIKPLLDRGFSPRGASALVLGSGGAARGVVAALVDRGIEKITIINRSGTRAEELMAWCGSRLEFTRITYGGDRSALDSLDTASFGLVVNTTPVGMHPHTGDAPVPASLRFRPNQTVYDLIYNPPQTMLLGAGERDGAVTINGMEMLVLQGLYSLARWFPERSGDIFSLQEEIMAYTNENITAR
jgi:shikimate dehydrogenase